MSKGVPHVADVTEARSPTWIWSVPRLHRDTVLGKISARTKGIPSRRRVTGTAPVSRHSFNRPPLSAAG
jgi:hypothetical protein